MEEAILPEKIVGEKTLKPPTVKLKNEQALELIVYFFILLFTYAGLRKLVDLEMFVKEVWGFAIFGSKQMVKVQFIILSCGELIVALLLTIARTRHLGIYGAFILAVTINVCFLIMHQFGKVIPPYYGGIILAVDFITHFIFNIAVLSIALLGVLWQITLNKKNTSNT